MRIVIQTWTCCGLRMVYANLCLETETSQTFLPSWLASYHNSWGVSFSPFWCSNANAFWWSNAQCKRFPIQHCSETMTQHRPSKIIEKWPFLRHCPHTYVEKNSHLKEISFWARISLPGPKLRVRDCIISLWKSSTKVTSTEQHKSSVYSACVSNILTNCSGRLGGQLEIKRKEKSKHKTWLILPYRTCDSSPPVSATFLLVCCGFSLKCQSTEIGAR